MLDSSRPVADWLLLGAFTMSDASSGKVCVVCGESCEGRPRVKDPKGRYFCRECYEKAREQKRRQDKENKNKKENGRGKDDRSGTAEQSSDASEASGSAPTQRRAPASIGAEDWGMGLADDLDVDHSDDSCGLNIDVSDDDSDSDSDATASSAAGTCPNCGADFPLAAVICVNCGFNTTTGHTVEAKVGGTIVAKDEVPTNTIWPSVIGILAVVVGVGFAGLSIWGLVELLLGDGEAAVAEGVEIDSTWSIIISSILSLPFIGMMLWHGFAGIGLIQRREWGYRHMALWTKVVISIVSVVFILIAGLLGVLGFLAGTVMAMVIFIIAMAIATAIFLAWPIFLMLWLNRPRIEAEVEEWD